MEMELVEIIAQLENNTGLFPRQALNEAISQQEAITPVLLATLEKWKDNLVQLAKLDDYFLHIYALFLLAQFKEVRAYPLIIDFFSTPGNLTLDVTADIGTEDLGRIFANVSHGHIEPLKTLIENPQVNEFVRRAGLQSLLVLVAQQTIERELVIEYFQQLFQSLPVDSSKDSGEPDFFWTNLVLTSTRIYPAEVQTEIKRAFDLDLVNLFFIDYTDIEDQLELGKDASMAQLQSSSSYSFIEDAITELENSGCWQTPIPSTVSTGKKSSKSNKKKAKNKMQKQSRRQNRSSKK